MIRRFAFAFAAGALAVLLVGFSLAAPGDEPAADQPDDTPRLKKKNKPLPEVPGRDDPDRKPAPEDRKPEQPKEDERLQKEDDPGDGPDVAQQEQDKELLARVGKSMRTSEDRLANVEVGDGTREAQNDALKGLDELIERKKQQQQQQQQSASSGGQGAQREQSGQPGQADKSQAPGQRAQGSQGSRGGLHRERPNQVAQGQRPGQGQNPSGQGSKPDRGGQGDKTAQGQPTNPNQSGNKNGTGAPGSNPGQGGSGDGKDEANKLAEVYKDVWGHLPESRRAEMDAYAREKFMPKYSDLIKQYYSTLSEKSRRPGD